MFQGRNLSDEDVFVKEVAMYGCLDLEARAKLSQIFLRGLDAINAAEEDVLVTEREKRNAIEERERKEQTGGERKKRKRQGP